MNLFYCCLVAAAFSLALADVKHVKESAVEKKVEALASDKSSDSKPKRDASHVSGVYHGPSYKYLPPSSISSYDTYSGGVGNGGHISGVGGGYTSGGFGHNHHGFSSSGHHSSGAIHGLGYAPSASYHGSGHHGLGLSSSSHYAGHGSAQHSGGFKGGVGSYKGVTFGHGEFASRPHSYAVGHGYGSSGSGLSGVGYKTHSLGAANAGSGSGYHYSKGVSGSFSSGASSGFGSGQGFSNSHGSGLAGVHHGDHVHNGAQEHIYVISSGPAGFGNSQGAGSVGQHGSHDVPTGSYLPPVQQHPLPSSSYGVPIATVGDSYNTKYHSQASAVVEHGPSYAAGHKGLGHFSFASNKPQVLHTSITGSSKPQVLHTSITGSGFNQPSYSKAPFKPSEFLGAQFEGTAHNDAPGQQYLPPSGVGADASGYDYPIPSGSSINFQEPSYQQTVEVQTASVHEPESAYLPPSNNEGSFNEIPSGPSGNYLPPSNTYATVGDSYNTKYHSQASAVVEHGPSYAAGHKGLGHFSFASNKPQVLHTSITGSSKPQVLHTSITGSGFNQPSYSKAPFKPSEFLGAQFEGTAHNDAPGQQYLPPSGVGADASGYDYPIPSGSSINFQEPSYQQTVEVQTASVHEPESAYLPPSNNEGSFNEIPSGPSGNYLPPSNTYGVPYSH